MGFLGEVVTVDPIQELTAPGTRWYRVNTGTVEQVAVAIDAERVRVREADGRETLRSRSSMLDIAIFWPIVGLHNVLCAWAPRAGDPVKLGPLRGAAVGTGEPQIALALRVLASELALQLRKLQPWRLELDLHAGQIWEKGGIRYEVRPNTRPGYVGQDCLEPCTPGAIAIFASTDLVKTSGWRMVQDAPARFGMPEERLHPMPGNADKKPEPQVGEIWQITDTQGRVLSSGGPWKLTGHDAVGGWVGERVGHLGYPVQVGVEQQITEQAQRLWQRYEPAAGQVWQLSADDEHVAVHLTERLPLGKTCWRGTVIDRRGPRHAFMHALVKHEMVVDLSAALPVLDQVWVEHATAPLRATPSEPQRPEMRAGQRWRYEGQDGEYRTVLLLERRPDGWLQRIEDDNDARAIGQESVISMRVAAWKLVDEAVKETAVKVEPAVGQLWRYVVPNIPSHRTLRLVRNVGGGGVPTYYHATIVDDDVHGAIGQTTYITADELHQRWKLLTPAIGQTWMRRDGGHYAVVTLIGRGVIDGTRIVHARSAGSGTVWMGVVEDGEGVALGALDESVPLNVGSGTEPASPFASADFPPFDPATWDPVFDDKRLRAYRAVGESKRARMPAKERRETDAVYQPPVSFAFDANFQGQQQEDKPMGFQADRQRMRAEDYEDSPVLLDRDVNRQLSESSAMLAKRLQLPDDCDESLYDVLRVRLYRHLHFSPYFTLRQDLGEAMPLWPLDTINVEAIENEVTSLITQLAEQQRQWEASEEGMRRREGPGIMERTGAALGTLADEGGEAAWNVAAIKAVDWGKAALVSLLARKLAPGDRALRNRIAKVVATDGGTVAVAFALSGLAAAFGSKVAPALGIDTERLDYLAKRLRVMGMTQGGVALVDSIIAELRSKAGPLIAMLQAMPSLPTELPAPRIRDSQRDDPDVAVADVTANGAPARGQA
jgi:hypothetical protein